MGERGSFENPIVLDGDEHKKNFPPTTPVSERPNEPLRLFRSCPFGGRIENVPNIVYRTLFEQTFSVRVSIFAHKYLKSFNNI